MNVSVSAPLILFIVLFFGAILLTIVIELLIARLLGYDNPLLKRLIVWMNVLTNPILNLILMFFGLIFGFMPYFNSLRWILLVILEGFVVLVEYALLKNIFKSQYEHASLLKLAIVMNVASFGVGAILSLLL